MVVTNLDLDVLRTFVTGVELGSFARAATRVGRSQSAVSAQLRKLEEQVGQGLLRKQGRGLGLTDAGEVMLGYARRLLELNDAAVSKLRVASLEGTVRVGLPQDFAELWLPSVLGRFARQHSSVRIDVQVERSGELVERVRLGTLDFALAWGEAAGARVERLAELPIAWIGPKNRDIPSPAGEPMPLVAFEAPCRFRSAGAAALDQAGMPWRVAFSSPSLTGLWAAVTAGLGVTLRTRVGLPGGVRALDPAEAGLPPLPSIPLALHIGQADPTSAATLLAALLRETLVDVLAPMSAPA